MGRWSAARGGDSCHALTRRGRATHDARGRRALERRAGPSSRSPARTCCSTPPGRARSGRAFRRTPCRSTFCLTNQRDVRLYDLARDRAAPRLSIPIDDLPKYSEAFPFCRPNGCPAPRRRSSTSARSRARSPTSSQGYIRSLKHATRGRGARRHQVHPPVHHHDVRGGHRTPAAGVLHDAALRRRAARRRRDGGCASSFT